MADDQRHEHAEPPAGERGLKGRMRRLGVAEGDLRENFILGSGPGGQKINKTASCVQLRHEPSGIEIRCQQARSRARNRVLARHELCDRLEERAARQAAARRSERERERRRRRQPSKAQKKRMVEAKRRQGEKKRLRRSPASDS